MTAPASDPTTESAWAPLRITIFRWLWIASLASNVGTFMHNVGASWLMTDLTRSPTLISLLQTVYAAPGFLLALPAGALADVVDRKKLLVASQSFMLAVATTMGVLTLTDRITTTWLLLLTFLLSVGGTVNMPVWTSITPEVVPRDELPQAVALNSISSNLAQSVGPAVAGLLIAASGSGAVFLVNAASFVGVVVVVSSWRREAPVTTMPAEHIWSAIRTGLRFTRHSPSLLVLLGRLALFVLFSSSLSALLPLHRSFL
ncbi:MAG TPA: MFS transporter [Microthrixaceae bacterium]|nr:MFS transporter [Microthrixaceae bacterium]